MEVPLKPAVHQLILLPEYPVEIILSGIIIPQTVRALLEQAVQDIVEVGCFQIAWISTTTGQWIIKIFSLDMKTINSFVSIIKSQDIIFTVMPWIILQR